MPAGTRYVGRGSKFGNCYDWRIRMRTHGETELEAKRWAVDAFERTWTAHENGAYRPYLDELRGQDVDCWCALSDPCHGDVLLRLANKRS